MVFGGSGGGAPGMWQGMNRSRGYEGRTTKDPLSNADVTGTGQQAAVCEQWFTHRGVI